MDSTIKKRSLYEQFLSQVKLLGNVGMKNSVNDIFASEGLDEWERMVIADALEEVMFSAGEDIVVQGDDGFDFFIIVDG